MAKYAVENGVMKASKHFSKVLGKPVNESSIRTMKKSYILKKVTTESDEFQDGLQCDKRGRPILLGTFEKDVIDYIKIFDFWEVLSIEQLLSLLLMVLSWLKIVNIWLNSADLLI